TLDGVSHQLDSKSQAGGHCLHGGPLGFHRQRFEAEQSEDGQSVRFRYRSPDGDAGFPGNLSVLVSYQIADDHSLVIDFEATTDASTVVNLVNHAYFNLNGSLNGAASTIDNHQVRILADRYTPVDDDLIPTGELLSVEGTRFDLRRLTSLIAADGNSEPRRFDHNFVLPEAGGKLRLAAELHSPESGIGMQLHTTQPGLQLFTGDYLEPPFQSRQGLCLEAQGFPDAPNQPAFPSPRLDPGEVYRQRTVYTFTF
ncbi:MAG: aldose epimerase family protein, partial [Pseudomonadota bacterium]